MTSNYKDPIFQINNIRQNPANQQAQSKVSGETGIGHYSHSSAFGGDYTYSSIEGTSKGISKRTSDPLTSMVDNVSDNGTIIEFVRGNKDPLTGMPQVTIISGTLDEPLFPNEPLFSVPSNPLLPSDYKEVLSYDAIQYANGFLRSQIGRFTKVEQIVGSNIKETIEGFLIGVGINYILLKPKESEIILVDFYTIKNISFFFDVPPITP